MDGWTHGWVMDGEKDGDGWIDAWVDGDHLDGSILTLRQDSACL